MTLYAPGVATVCRPGPRPMQISDYSPVSPAVIHRERPGGYGNDTAPLRCLDRFGGWQRSIAGGVRVRLLRPAPSVVLVAAMLLTGSACGGDPSAEPSPSVSDPSTRSSPTQSATTPPKPHAPIAFVKAWVEASNEATKSGDTTILRQFIAPQCVNCIRLLTAIDRIYAAGGYIHSRGWGILNIHEIAHGSLRSPVVSLTIVTYPERYKRTKHSLVKTSSRGKGVYTVWLRRLGKSFTITRIDPVA
jgi:hypothetical protein